MISQKTKTHENGIESKTIIDIGNLLFFKNFVLLEINEGADLNFDQLHKIQCIAENFYGNRFYGYICNRKTSYSLNPVAYRILNSIENLKCLAIVKEFSGGHDIEVERHFIKKPFEVFKSFEEASDWINSFI